MALATFVTWDWRFLTTILVFLVTYYVVRFYYKVSNFPKGPFPLPAVGNLLALSREKEVHKKAVEWAKVYGDPFTLWMGSQPMVVINGYDVIKEGFIEKRHQFAGRYPTKMGDAQRRNDSDVIFEDYNATWKVLRKVAATAVRKYAASESLEQLSAEVVDAYVDLLGDNQKTVDARDPLLFIIVNIIGMSAFSKKFDPNSTELARIKEINLTFAELAPNGFPSDISPFLGVIYRAREKKLEQLFEDIRCILKELYEEAKSSFASGNIENFTHAVMSAREEAIKKEKSDAEFLTEGNMVQILIDLFNAGTDTSIGELQWLLLKLSREPKIQEKIQEEIHEKLGHSPPTMKDRENLPYTVACIMETLRFYPVAPMGLPHKASCDSELGGVFIPKDTRLLYNIYGVNHDPELWTDPEAFRPERFLEPTTGQLLATEKMPPLLSFGLGPRSCPGEKLALADMFYVLVRLLQRVRVGAPEGLISGELNPQRSGFFLRAGEYNIVLSKRHEVS